MTRATFMIGVGVLVWRDGKILGGIRKGGPDDGTWAIPGGSLEFNEEVIACAHREVLEETGVTIKNARILDTFPTPGLPQSLDVLVSAEWDAGEPKTMEPEKCEEWTWEHPHSLPQPLFPSLAESFRRGTFD